MHVASAFTRISTQSRDLSRRPFILHPQQLLRLPRLTDSRNAVPAREIQANLKHAKWCTCHAKVSCDYKTHTLETSKCPGNWDTHLTDTLRTVGKVDDFELQQPAPRNGCDSCICTLQTWRCAGGSCEFDIWRSVAKNLQPLQSRHFRSFQIYALRSNSFASLDKRNQPPHASVAPSWVQDFGRKISLWRISSKLSDVVFCHSLLNASMDIYGNL